MARVVTKKSLPMSFEVEARERHVAQKAVEFETYERPAGVIPMLALDSFYGDELAITKGEQFLVATEKRADDLVSAGLASRV